MRFVNVAFVTIDSAALLYTYISRFSVNPHYQQREKIQPTFAFTGESGYTLGFRGKIAHNGLHAETGSFRMGALSLPSNHFARFGNPAWPGVRTANFAAFGSWPGVLPKNAESLRNSDAHDARRCPEASRPRWAAQSCCYIYLWMGGGTKTLFA